MPNDNNQNQEDPSSATQPVTGTPAQFSPNAVEPLGVKKPKKSKKTLFTILGAVGVFVLVAGSTITYLLLNNRTSEPVVDANVSALPALGETLKSSLDNPSNVSTLIYQSSNPATVVQKLQNNVWISTDENSEVLSFSSGRDSQSSNESDYNRIVERIKSEGLTELETSSGEMAAYDATNATTRYFASDKLTCVLRNTPENGAYSLQVDCAAQSEFDNNKAVVKPYAEVYSTGQESTDKDILFGKPDVQNSATENYKTARINTYELSYFGDSSSAMFYQTPDEKWHFFMNVKDQDKISCADYEGSDIINAYLGFTCWDASVNASSFVLRDNPTFEIEAGASGG